MLGPRRCFALGLLLADAASRADVMNVAEPCHGVGRPAARNPARCIALRPSPNSWT
jgi:hypothetical protein